MNSSYLSRKRSTKTNLDGRKEVYSQKPETIDSVFDCVVYGKRDISGMEKEQVSTKLVYSLKKPTSIWISIHIICNYYIHKTHFYKY